MPEPSPDRYRPPTGSLRVLHRDRDLLVIDKPAGLLSVPGRRPGWQDSALLRLRAMLKGEQGAGQGGLWAVHRLDMDTSGVLVFALRRKAERSLRQQFLLREVEKEYVAIVFGQPPEQGIIDLPLARVGGWPPRNRVDRKVGLQARTEFSVLSRTPTAARLSLLPKTGRSHQLRVHLAAIGHPILGDRFYALPEVQASAPRLMLHAACLVLAHPFTGERLELVADPPF